MGGVDPSGGWGVNSEGGQNATVAAANAGVSGAQQAYYYNPTGSSGSTPTPNPYQTGSSQWYQYEELSREQVARNNRVSDTTDVIKQALTNAQKRPGYSTDIGDSKTAQYVAQLRQQNPNASDDQLKGIALEQQRQDAIRNGDREAARFYLNEKDKWAENKVETSSAYHALGMIGGVPIAANPFEYQGDLAVEYLKGKPTKTSEWFSPVSGQMSVFLPGGQGTQQYGWDLALGKAKENVSFMAGTEALGSAEGMYGPYGFLLGGKPDTKSLSGNWANGTGRTIGGKTVAGQISTIGIVTNANTLNEPSNAKKPFISANAININEFLLPEDVITPTITPSTPTQKYEYRNDPLAIALEGGVYAGDSLLFGQASPGKELLTRYGQNENKVYDTFNTQKTALEKQQPEYDALNTKINGEQATIESLLKGHVNAEGKFTGTADEYAAYQSTLTALNQDVAKFNAFGQQQKDVIENGLKSGAIIKTNGGYIENPDNVREYGAFSEWSRNVGFGIQNAVGIKEPWTESKFIQFEQSLAFAALPVQTQFGEGVFKQVATNPAGLGRSAIQGVELYALTAGIGNALEFAAPAEGVAAATTGQRVAGAGQKAFPWVNTALGLGFISAGVWQSTEGFKATPSQSASNLGGMSAHFGAMALGATAPEGIAKSVNYGTIRFAEKPMVTHDVVYREYGSIQPDIMSPSGVGGEIKWSVSDTFASQPTLKLGKYELAFPRITSPKVRSMFTETGVLGEGDMSALINARQTGTSIEPSIHNRIETLRTEEYRSEKNARGTGNVQTMKWQLPRTIDEYNRMGAADARISGKSQEEMTSSLMKDAMRVTEPQVGYRDLSVTVQKGTHPMEAFDWTTDIQGSNELSLNRMNLEDYFGKMRVARVSGTHPQQNYQIDVTRDWGLSQGGNYEVTGSRTPESKIVTQLQKTSKEIVPNTNERGYAFDSRGNLISEEIGDPHSMNIFPLKEVVASNKGDIGYVAHQHPSKPLLTDFRLDLFGDNAGGISPDWTFEYTIGNIRQKLGGFGHNAIPSRNIRVEDDSTVHGDINSFLGNTPRNLQSLGLEGNINGEFITSNGGVTIFRPNAETGWKSYRPIRKLPIETDWNTPQEKFRIYKSTGADIGFVGKNEKYVGKGYIEHVSSATPEMQASYPEGIRGRMVNAVDRMTLKDQNLEFIRDQQAMGKEPSLLESGSNLGRGGGTMSLSPSASGLIQQQQPQFGYKGKQPGVGTIKPPLPSKENVRIGKWTPPATKSQQTPKQANENIRMVSPMVGITSLVGNRQNQKNRQIQTPETITVKQQKNFQLQVPQQKTGKETVKVVSIASTPLSQIKQKQDQETIQTVEQVPIQTPKQKTEQIPKTKPITVPWQITPNKPIKNPPEEEKQKPTTKVPPLIPIGWLPGGNARSPQQPKGHGAYKFKEVSPTWTPGEMGRSLFTGSFKKQPVQKGTRMPKMPSLGKRRRKK